MTKTLTLFRGSKAATLTFEPPTNTTERHRIIANARAVAKATLLAGEAPSTTAWRNFDTNLASWIDGGFDGALSIGKAMTNAAAPEDRTSVVDVFRMGTEQELRGVKITGAGVEYSAEMAKTRKVSGDWPLMTISADQVHGDSGCIEVVFGPVDVTNKRELERRGTAVKLLESALADHSGATLGAAVGAYNAAIRDSARTDPKMGDYAVDLVADAALEVSPGFQAVQTNVEVPLAKIGELEDTSIPALFGGRNEADDKAMFVEARKCANELVDDLFRPTAAEVHGGAFAPESIKLDKMRGTFTLLLYGIAKVSQQQRKGAWPVLPKVGVGDLVRETFNLRDKLVLYHHTSDAGRMATLESRVLDAAQSVKNKREFGRSIGTKERALMAEELRYLLEPGANPDRWGDETRTYGKVDWANNDYTGTICGKPIKTTYTRALRHLTSKSPKVVLEVRRMGNPINATIEGLAKSGSLDGASSYAILTEAAKASTKARVPKTAV